MAALVLPKTVSIAYVQSQQLTSDQGLKSELASLGVEFLTAVDSTRSSRPTARSGAEAEAVKDTTVTATTGSSVEAEAEAGLGTERAGHHAAEAEAAVGADTGS